MPRITLVCVGALALLAFAAPAQAQFDPAPSACDARLSPWAGRAVFSAHNPNPGPTVVDLGSDNLLLEPPFIRPNQPDTFPPGFTEGIFDAVYEPTGRPTVSWFLLGAVAANTDAPCQGVDPPVNTVLPRIDGQPTAGGTVTLDPGTWSGGGPADVRLALFIEACGAHGCEPVRAESGLGPGSYTVGPELAGLRLRLRVVGYSWRGVGAAESPLTAPVTGTATPTAPSVRFPSDVHWPAIHGRTVIAPSNLLDWAGVPLPALAYQWQRCMGADCVVIPGATAVAHRLEPADAGRTLRVVVTATNSSGTATSTSRTVAVGADVTGTPAAPVPLAGPRLEGASQVGKAMTALPGEWAAADRLTYGWQRCAATCADIAGADDPSYVPGPADRGARLRAVLVATSDAPARSGSPARYGFATEPSEPVAPADTAPPADDPSGGADPTVPPPPPTAQPPTTVPPARADRTRPRLTRVRLTAARFRASRRPTALAARRSSARRGSRIDLTVSEPVWLRVDVRRAGRRRRPLGTLTRTLPDGRRHVRFSGRLGRRPLRPGRYVLRLGATDAAGNRSRPRTLRFRIVK